MVQGQLTLQALPDMLFVDNGGVHGVELGTVVRARCTASSSSSAPLLTWFKDGGILASDAPHIRIRSSSSGSEVSSVLTVDNFDSGDNGDYYCEASNDTDTLASTTLSLSVDLETVGLSNTLKSYDTVRDNRSSFTIGDDFEPNQFTDSCCQVLRCIAGIPGDQTQATNISQLTVTWLRNEEEVVHSAGQTEITIDLRYLSAPDETRYVSQLRLLPFETSDIGVYQCVYSDFDSDRELVYSTPFSLDTDNSSEVMLEAVSPTDIILDPPEKLVIEVESSGGYYRHACSTSFTQLTLLRTMTANVPSAGTFSFTEAIPRPHSHILLLSIPHTVVPTPAPRTNDTTNITDTIVVEVRDLSGSANITIEEGVGPSVSIANIETAVAGDDVTLNCTATGDTPLVYQWTIEGSTTVLNSDNTTGTLELADIQENQFGTYVCTVTNDLGMATSEVILEQAVAPTAGNNTTLTFSVGDDLVLMAVFSDFNLELDSIVWTQNSSISLMDGVTISNTALSPPSASSTLTRPGITGVSYGGKYTATASNRAGSSSTTFTVHIIIMRVQFQLRLVGLSDCLQWREIQPNEKKEAVITGVTRAVNELCQCDFSRDSFNEIDVTAGFQCFEASPTAVTFRAEIMDIAKANTSQLIGYIEQWVTSRPTIVVLGSRLSIDSDCEIEIDSFSEPECLDTDRETPPERVDGSRIGNHRKASYKVESDSVYETIPDFPPIVAMELTNISASRHLPGSQISPTSIPTEENPSYAIHIGTQDNPAYITQRGTVDDPTYDN
ncbi:hypothetical protein GBAR_LOCUS29303 [Geodia barretti]|nr:hypothetical protein GBAR_LOCUS29303 [Geodia barretti]